MMYVATLRLGERDAAVRAKAVSGAKHLIGRHGRLIGQRAIQLHGGMGMTEEMSVGHYFKRLTMIDVMFGDEAISPEALRRPLSGVDCAARGLTAGPRRSRSAGSRSPCASGGG